MTLGGRSDDPFRPDREQEHGRGSGRRYRRYRRRSVRTQGRLDTSGRHECRTASARLRHRGAFPGGGRGIGPGTHRAGQPRTQRVLPRASGGSPKGRPCLGRTPAAWRTDGQARRCARLDQGHPPDPWLADPSWFGHHFPGRLVGRGFPGDRTSARARCDPRRQDHHPGTGLEGRHRQPADRHHP